MPTTDSQALRDARGARARAALGLSGIPPADWTYDQRTAYNKAVAAAILADSAGATAQDLATAQRVSAKDYSPLERYAFGDQVGDFFGEVVNQAEEINPLSERNRSTSRLVIIGAILLAAVAYFGVLAGRSRAVIAAAK
jgi:hypothetical protein